MPKTIRQTAKFRSAPLAVYEALMDSRIHAKFSHARTRISRKIGGAFTAYDGYIEGRNITLVPGKRIVQSWRGSDWPEGHYSRVTFVFRRIKGGTQMSFTQSGVPDDKYLAIKKGWKEFYWEPMKSYLDRAE